MPRGRGSGSTWCRVQRVGKMRARDTTWAWVIGQRERWRRRGDRVTYCGGRLVYNAFEYESSIRFEKRDAGENFDATEGLAGSGIKFSSIRLLLRLARRGPWRVPTSMPPISQVEDHIADRLSTIPVAVPWLPYADLWTRLKRAVMCKKRTFTLSQIMGSFKLTRCHDLPFLYGWRLRHIFA